MEWTNRDMLKRIAALLFALAELADRAGLAPYPVRILVLGILRHAEAVAQAFVIGVARDLGVTLQADLSSDGVDDTTRLAFSLRVLALTLASLAAWAECIVSHGLIDEVATVEMPRKPGQLACSQSIPPPDTS